MRKCISVVVMVASVACGQSAEAPSALDTLDRASRAFIIKRAETCFRVSESCIVDATEFFLAYDDIARKPLRIRKSIPNTQGQIWLGRPDPINVWRDGKNDAKNEGHPTVAGSVLLFSDDPCGGASGSNEPELTDIRRGVVAFRGLVVSGDFLMPHFCGYVSIDSPILDMSHGELTEDQFLYVVGETAPRSYFPDDVVPGTALTLDECRMSPEELAQVAIDGEIRFTTWERRRIGRGAEAKEIWQSEDVVLRLANGEAIAQRPHTDQDPGS